MGRLHVGRRGQEEERAARFPSVFPFWLIEPVLEWSLPSQEGIYCVLPGLAQETDYQNLWSIVVLLPDSAMLFLKGVLESWFIEAIAAS